MQEKWLYCSAGSLNVGWNMTDLAVLESVRSVFPAETLFVCVDAIRRTWGSANCVSLIPCCFSCF